LDQNDESINQIEIAIKNVLNGDINAFGFVIDTYQKPLFRYCFHMLGSIHESEDVVQDVFLKAFEKLNFYKISSNFSAWIYKIAYNQCINQIRRKRILKMIPFLEEHYKESTTIEYFHDKYEYSLELNTALKKLDSKDRTIIILRCTEDKSYEEISSIVDLKPASVRKRFERSKKKLKTILGHSKGSDLIEGLPGHRTNV